MHLTNFRDLGGITTMKNQTIRSKMLLRSGELVNLDKTTQTELIQSYHLSQVIDFRRDFEIQERPDDQLPGVKLINLDVLSSATKNASLDDFVTIGAVQKVDQHMLGIYHDLVLDINAQKAYAEFLQLVLANDTGATLFHCFAGKDRTGFGAALILSLLGVDEKQIMQDYLQTNQDRQQANNEIIDFYQKQGANVDSIEALRIALYVKPEYLQLSQQLIKTNYGDVFNYAQTELNFRSEQVEQLQDKFLQ